MKQLFRGTLPLLIVISCLQKELLATQSAAGQVGGACLSGLKSCIQKNSECVENKCLCSNFYRHVNGSCVSYSESTTLNQQCLSGADCRGAGEFCSSFSICMCLSTHVDVGAQCKPAVYPGQFGCEDSRQCNKGFPGAECDSSRVCVCPHGMQANQQTCVVASSLSNTMLSDDQISRSLYQRSPERMPALNLPVHSRRRYSPSAAQNRGGVRPNDLCSVDTDCAGYPYSFCSGTCRCAQDALDAGETCIPQNKPTSMVCAPGQTWVSEAGACMTVQQPGEPCQYSQQCSASESGAFCRRLKCECVYGMKASGAGCTFQSTNCSGRKGFIWIPEIGDCREVLPPGSSGCSHSLQCTEAFPEARCISGTCTCPFNAPTAIDGTCGTNCSAGETFSGVTGRCIPTVQPGDNCLYSSQCHALHPGMTCDRNRCRCPSGLVFTGNMCAQTCSNGYIADNRGICKPGCRPTQVEFEGNCLDQATPSQPCQVNAQCTGGSSCQNGICICPRAMVPRGAVCIMIESPPQGSCRLGENCSGGSTCQNGVCICPAGRQIVNQQCITPLTVPPNSPCGPSVVCGGASTCIAGFCTCATNQQVINGECQIPPLVAPGNPCPSGFERCMGQSTCSNGVCECPVGTFPSQNECLPVRYVQAGAPCSQTTKCIGLSQCIDGICKCPAGLVIQDGDCRAASQVAPGSSCASGEVCSGGSFCIGLRCTCPPGTQEQNGACQGLSSANPGQSCLNGEICTGGSNCQGSFCVCPLGMEIFLNNCQQTTSDLGQCDTLQQCSGGAYCDIVRNRCSCPAGTVAVGSFCVPTQDFNIQPATQRACQYDSDCDDTRKCVLRKCQCQFGELFDGTCRNLWVSGNNRVVRRHEQTNANNFRLRFSALPRKTEPAPPSSIILSSTPNNVKIGDSCLHPNARCVATADCIAGICVCGMGKTPVNNERCVEYRSASPGESCSRGEECVGGSHCNQQSMKCDCENTHIRIGSQCTPRLRARPGYGCNNGEVCSFGSICVRGNCVCPEGMTESRARGEKECLKEALPDAFCSNGEACSGGSSCQSGVCRCERGQQIVNNHCIEVRVVNPGSSCHSPLVRCGGGAFCVRGSCECPSNMTPNEEKCVTPRQVSPGYPCSSDDICMARSICKDGQCQCTRDMTLRNGHCVMKVKSYPNEACLPEDECLGGSSCDGRKCICPPGHVIRNDVCTERQKVRPGLPCRSDDLCIGQSICFEGLCQCRRGEKIIQGACTKFSQVHPGSNCSATDECLGGSACISGLCSCPTGHINVNNECKAVVKAVPGASCANQEQCEGGSVCDQSRKVCLCKDGFQPRQGVCIKATPAERKPAAIRKTTVVLPTYSIKKAVITPSPIPPSQPIRATLPSTRPPAVIKAKPKLPAWLSILASTSTTVRPSRPQARVCSTKEDCQKGASCIDYKCKCNPNTVLQNGICVPMRGLMLPQRRKQGGLREPCLSDAHCHVAYSYCVPEAKICGCRVGFRGMGPLSDLKCVPEFKRTTIASTTLTSTTTTELPSTTQALTSTTSLPEATTQEDREPDSAEHRSISGPLEVRAPKFVLPGEDCDQNSFCNMGSYCVEGICKCAEEFNQEGNMCIRKTTHTIVRPLSNCTRGEVCGYSSDCIHGICLCIGHYTLFRDECRTLDEIELIHRRETDEKLESNYIPPPRGIYRLKITTPEPVINIPIPESTTSETRTTTEDIFDIITEEPVTVDPVTPPTDFFKSERPTTQIEETTTIPRATTTYTVTRDWSEIETLLKTPRPHFWFKVVSPGFECDELSFCSNCSVCLNSRCQCPEGLELIEGRCMSPIDARQCVASNQCPSGADCISGECRCKPGHALSRFGFCMPFTYVDPGMSCTEGEVCRGGSECREGMCACSEGLVTKENKCLPPSRVKRRIENNFSKLDKEFVDKINQVESAVVREQPPVTGTNSGSSLGRVPLGDRCSGSSVCSNGGACVSGICKCPQNMVQAGISCLERATIGSSIVSPGSSCQEGIFCDGGASCVNYECKCPSGFVIESSVCTPVLAKAGSSCTDGQRCSFGSICVQGSCICPEGLREIDGNCVTISTNTKKSPGISCLSNPNICTGGSFCIAGVCTCPLGMENVGGICRQGNVGIVNYAAPGGVCRDGQIICTGNSVCANGFCICPGGEQIKNDICVPIDSQADPDQPCEEGITVCTGNSQCNRGVCRCPEGQISLNGQCARVITTVTASPINCNPQCGQNSYCFSGNCHCYQGYQMTSGQCQPICNQQCQPNASCRQAGCQCNSGFVPSGNQCIPSQYPVPLPSLQPNGFTGAPGQPCDLRPGAMLCRERALCVMQQCICPTQLVMSNGRCVDFIGDAFPGQSCATPGIICRGGASCDQGICKCAFGYSPILNQCTNDFVFTFRPFPQTTQLPPIFELRPGAICEPRCEFEPCLQKCGGGSYCVSGRCSCPIGSYDFDGTCIPMQIDPATSRPPSSTPSYIIIRTARPDDNCDSSIKCTGGSSCILGTCLCPPGYATSFDRTSCISTSLVGLQPRSYPGEKCTLDADCEGNSFCLGKVCQCHSDEEVKDKSCKRRSSSGGAHPGSPCTSSSVCQFGSVCTRDYCICQEGTTTNSTGHCVNNFLSDTSSALPGAPCRMGGPPCEGSSYCNDGNCLCMPGSTSKNGKCSGEQETRSTPPKGLGDYCSLQTDCTSMLHATCLNYKCSCTSAYEQKDGQCVLKNSGSKKSCTSYRDCDSPRVCSRNNVCECPFTMAETNTGVCVYKDNAVPLESFCDIAAGVKCQDPGICQDHLCVCQPGFIEKDGTCIPQLTRTISKSQLGRPVEETLTPCPLDNSCKLPECFCSRTGTVAPGGFMSKDVPQMVVLAFDDPITDRTINIYKAMFSGKHRNPNGCPIKGTFFVSHQFNNYDQTQWLYSRGNEIAINSITHENLMNATKERWRHEMVGLRDSLKGFSYVDETSMMGIRAPHLLMGGDSQFDMMKENGFLYDSSMPVREGPVWPQTLDHKLSWDCGEQNCPTRPHKGLWEIPLQLLISQEGIWHSVARTAIKPHYSRDAVNRLLQRNFYRNYNGNRAPFILNAESDFLTYLPDNGVVHAIDDFLKHILSKEDVFVVTISQMIEWMRRPVSIENINKFKPWQCNFRMNDHIQPCETPSICSYDSRSPAGIPHSFRVCGSCPKSYPWIEDPLGRKQLKK